MARFDDSPGLNDLLTDRPRRIIDENLPFSEMYPYEAARIFGSSVTDGLDPSRVRKQRAKYGANIQSSGDELTFRASLKRQYTNLLTVLLLFGVLLVYIFDRSAAALTVAIGAVVLSFVNAVLEHRAGVRLAELRKQTSSRAAVIRGGSLVITDSRSVVCGDVIFLEEGSIVPADARLIESNNLTVLETPVSGISSAAKKDARFIRKGNPSRVCENMVYAGSIVTGGSATALVCEVGDNVLMKRKSSRRGIGLPSVLRGTLSEGRLVTIAAAVFEIILMLVGVIAGADLAAVFVSSLGVGAVALTDTVFAFSAFTFADCLKTALDGGAAVRNLDSIPALVGINSVMCDKQTAFPPTVIKADRLYDCFSECRQSSGSSSESAKILRYMLLCSSVNVVAGSDKIQKDAKKERPLADRFTGSALTLSLMEAAEGMGLDHAQINKGFYRIESEYDSHGEMRRVLGLLDGSPVVIIKGAPENVISRCAGYRQGGTNYRFDEKSRRRALAFAEDISRTRTPIAVAVGKTTADSLRDITVERKLVLVGFAGLYSTFEVGAASAVYKCRQAGIEIVVSSDDSYYTAYNTAKNAGIIDGENEICTAESMRTSDEGLFIANCPRYKVFTGLSDDEWLYVERLRREDGKRVAVSASGMEQLPLMKEADVSFVPKRGSTDTLLATCDVQMINDGFDTITQTLKCARSAMKRISNTSEYFSVGFMTMFFWALLSLMLTGNLPFSGGDVFLFGMVVNVLLSISLAFAPQSRDILSEPPPSVRPRDKVVYYIMTACYSLAAGAICLLCHEITLPEAEGTQLTASLVAYALLLFFYSLMCGSRHSIISNKAYRNYLAFAMLAAATAIICAFVYIPALADFMGYSPLGSTQLLVAVCPPLIFFLIVQLAIFIKDRVGKGAASRSK